MAGEDKQFYIDKYGAEAQAAWEKSDHSAKSTAKAPKAGADKDKQYYIDKYGEEAQAAWEQSDQSTKSTGATLASWALELAAEQEANGTDPGTGALKAPQPGKMASADPYANYKGPGR